MLKLLLLEDKREDSVAIERALCKLPEKIDVIKAGTVQAGLELLETNRFDCILADFFLEDDNIKRLLQQLRTKHTSTFLPVIIISGVIDHEQACGLLDLGVSDFIPKGSISSGGLWFSIQNAIRRAAQTALADVELKQSQYILGRVFSSSSDAFIMATASREIVRFNAAAEELFGFSEADLIGKPTAVLYADTSDFEEQGRLRFNRDSKVATHSYNTVAYKKASGEIFPAQTIGGPIRDAEGELLGFMGIVRDISDELAQERMRENYTRRLKLSNMILEEFGHATSHTLLTPVQGMCRLAHWIEEELVEPPERVSEYLEMMQERGEMLENMLRDLRRFVRAGEIETENSTFDVESFLAEMRQKFGERFSLHYSGPESIDVPPDAFELVCDALLMNAIQHHDRKEGNVWLTLSPGEGGLSMTVEDDGPGIEPRHQERIFRLYQTLESRPQRIGAGLALVQRVLTVIGGEVGLESPVQDGRGARFTVRGFG
jgi:PAS domain S-box-containing protein